MGDVRPKFHLLPMDMQGWGLRSAGFPGGYAGNLFLGVTSGYGPTFGGAGAGSGLSAGAECSAHPGHPCSASDADWPCP